MFMNKKINSFNSFYRVLAIFICFASLCLFSMQPLLRSKTKAKALIAAMQSQKRKHEKQAEENKENRPPKALKNERTQELQKVYTRNYPKLAGLLAGQEPHHAQALIHEARDLTPYLSHVHYQQYPTRAQNPDAVSPLKEVTKHTKKRESKLYPGEIAAARQLFTPEEHWSYEGPAPYGYTIQQRDELVDPFQEDEEGVINLAHMLQGNAPYGPDLNRINLHHWLRQDPGPLAELSGTFHRRETGPLHGVLSRGIQDRVSFDQFRRLYWEGRAFDILESMGLTP